MNILIIGNNGFIGTHLTRQLSRTHTVRTADIVGTSSASHTVIDPKRPDFKSLVVDAKPDLCINCAGAADVGASFEAPAFDFMLNVLRVYELLEALRAYRPEARFINFSSAAVYGNPAEVPTSETCPLSPVSPYGWHKYQAELICREFAEMYGVGTLSLRVFSAFGPGLRKQLFWDVFKQSRSSAHLSLFGTGEETRDYIFIGDLVRSVEHVIVAGCFDGGAINVANGSSVTIRHAVETLLDRLGWRGKIEFSGVNRPGDPLKWQADISYLRSLGYRPSHTFEAGIEELAQWLIAQG